MNYKERALTFQTSYVLMSKLYEEIKEKEKNDEKYDDLKNQYDMIISLTENHSYGDYLQVMYEVKDNKDYEQVNGKWTLGKCLTRFIYKFMHFFKIAFLFIIPIIIVIISLVIQ